MALHTKKLYNIMYFKFDIITAMKGNSNYSQYERELVAGVNQYAEVVNPPWMQSVKAESVVPL